MRSIIALAVGLCLAASAVPASAQNPSYEKRGYGGPLYVGPNFEQGGQHTPPVWGQKPAKKVTKQAVPKKPPRQIAKTPKAPAEEEAAPETTSTGVAASSTETEAGTSDSGSSTSGEGTTSSAATCKKFDSTAGKTIDVPCE